MRSRAWLAAIAALGGIAPAYVACSSDSTEGGFEPVDASVADVTIDTGARHDAAQPFDAGTDAAPPPDTGPGIVGKCEPVQGPACDLVLQDCPAADGGAQQECLVDPNPLPDGGSTTACVKVTPSEHLGKGHSCCPAVTDKQCDPGLECVGDPNAPCDGGSIVGRCTPHCCGSLIDGGDDYLCGQSDPEGYQGHCDTQLVDQGGNPLFNVCSYTRPCEPFGIKSCPAGFTCDFRDTTGTAGCDDIYVPDGGPAPKEDEACWALNGCLDGLACLGSGNPGVCVMMCVTPGSKPPFDAGALDGGPFHGGCSAGKSCTLNVQGFPPWISFCQ